jgi:hypothetical protein
MAPELPADLVVLDLKFEENHGEENRLKVTVETIERTHETRVRGDLIHVTWNAVEQPVGYFPVAEGAVYVRETPETVKYSYTAEPDHVADSGYGWIQSTTEAIMMVLVFPDGYVPTQCKPDPVRAKAMKNNRLAVYWIFQGIEKNDPAHITWQMQKKHGSLADAAAQMNDLVMNKSPNVTKKAPVVLEEMDFSRDLGVVLRTNGFSLAGDRNAVWAFGAASLAFLMALVFYGPSNLPPDYKPIVRFVAALAGGLLSYFFVGKLHLGGRIPGINDVHIAAFGGFAVFIFVMIFWAH